MIVVHIAGIPISESEQRCIRCNCDIRKLPSKEVPAGTFVHHDDILRSTGGYSCDANPNRRKTERVCFPVGKRKRPVSVPGA